MIKQNSDDGARLSRFKLLLMMLFISLLLAIEVFLNGLTDRELPTIQGTLLSSALAFEAFELHDHHNQVFTNKNFSNNWFLISYGYTQCPDVCPTTLMLMKQFSERLNLFDNTNQVKLIFYTIDPLRDTQQVLMQYMNYFGDNFIGLRPNDNDSYLNFEQTLALKYLIKSSGLLVNNQINNSDKSSHFRKENSYQVSHGLTLYLINPEGKLQAILQPKIDPFGVANFTVEQIYQDFIISRQYYQRKIKS